MAQELTSTEVRRFRRVVYGYFAEHARDLPWRRRVSAYSTFVSEIMLQQTQVPRVTEKFREWMQHFPTWERLAASELADVLKIWSGLGYNRRAKFLHNAAHIVMQTYKGKLPRDPALLRTLPGVGPATAASIAAFGFNAPTVFIETNIRAVYIHHFYADQHDVADSELLPLITATLDARSPRRWYSALMDYGTHLKSLHSNPARRSRHHVRQSKFEGSARQLRGKVLRSVLQAPQKESQLLKLDTLARVQSVLTALQHEGLISKQRGVWKAGTPSP